MNLKKAKRKPYVSLEAIWLRKPLSSLPTACEIITNTTGMAFFNKLG